MAINHDRDSARLAAAWLATCFVCALGVAFCSAIILVFSEKPNEAFRHLFGSVAGLWLVLWLLNSGARKRRPAESDLEWLIRSKSLEQAVSLGSYKKKPSYREKMGQNRPPTLAEIREFAQTSSNNWIPSNYPKRK